MRRAEFGRRLNPAPRISVPPCILPGLYVSLVLTTFATSISDGGQSFYRLIGVNPVAGLCMMFFDNAPVIFTLFLVSGTPWWYLVGKIGWDSRTRRASRLNSGIGAVFTLSTGWIAAAVTG